MYNKIISIEERLRCLALEETEYAELWSTWNLNKKTLEPILGAIIKDYPHYSFHDHSHSESILSNIERALGNENIEKLSPTDLWLLLHVSYLHDFGMVIADTKIHEFWQTTEFQNFLREQSSSPDEDMKKAALTVLSREQNIKEYNELWPLEVKAAVTLLTSKYCRWQHAEMSRNYILDIKNIWGIDIGHNNLVKKRLVLLIADISVMHTKPFEEIYTLHKEANGFFNDYIHPRLIACLLRLGDALDLDNGRFNPYGEVIFGKMPDESKVHYNKHESTRHVLVNSEWIEVEADCQTDEIYRETRRWYDTLESEIKNMHLNWREIAPKEIGYPPKLASYKILKNGVEDLQELTNLRFSISQKKAFEILEGSSIYRDKFACIREIVQNAEDATKIQLWRDIKSGMYDSEYGIDREKVEAGTLLPGDVPEWIYQIYRIKIVVEKTEKNNAILSVEDHGTGISIQTLKEICNVGQSYFQTESKRREIEEMPVWMRPTATFGIGLQSCFLATDTLIIYTNSNKDGAFKMIFQSGQQEGYVNVERSLEMKSRGSRVTFEIENDYNLSYDMFGFADRKLRELEPFETNCFVLYKLIETIFKECAASFIPIDVISESIQYREKIAANVLSKKEFPVKPLWENALYSISEDRKVMTCWYQNNLYKIESNSLYRIMGCIVNIKFKGKRIGQYVYRRQNFPGFSIEVDIYGLSTKEALSLNREELNYEVERKIYQAVDEIIEEYIKLLLEDFEFVKNDEELVSVLALTGWLYNNRLPEKWYPFTSKENIIEMFVLDEKNNKYEQKILSIYDIVADIPKIPFINKDLVERYTGKEVTKEEIIDALNNSKIDRKNYQRLLTDKDIIRIFQNSFYNVNCIEGEKELVVCSMDVDDEIYTPDQYTRKKLIKSLVYYETDPLRTYSVNVMRRAIAAIADYKKLAVKITGILGIGYDSASKWKIISPISIKDAEKIEQFSKELFVDYIVKQNVFQNIVDYTMENGKYKSSREEITAEYKRLIQEYYDLVVTERNCKEVT